MDPDFSTRPNLESVLPERPATVWDGPSLIRNTALTFDPGDKVNGSLYICDPKGSSDPSVVDKSIASLRAVGLWSEQPARQVRDDQRSAYEEQLIFVEAVEFGTSGQSLILARFDHPKFPSSAERFEAWKNHLSSQE